MAESISQYPMVDKFLRYLQVEKNTSPLTVKNYAADISLFSNFLAERLGKDFQWQKIGVLDIRAYLALLNKEKYARTTIARRISSLRSFYKFLMRENYVEQNPFVKVRTPKLEKRLPVFLEELEIGDYINDINSYHLHMFDKHDVTTKKLDVIVEKAGKVDANYAAQIEGYCSLLGEYGKKFETVCAMLALDLIGVKVFRYSDETAEAVASGEKLLKESGTIYESFADMMSPDDAAKYLDFLENGSREGLTSAELAGVEKADALLVSRKVGYEDVWDLRNAGDLMKKETLEKLKEFNISDCQECLLGEKYVNFEEYLNHTVCGEGMVGENNYLLLWEKNEIEELNDDYETQAFLNNIILIGSDGGDMAYGIDISGKYIEVPFIGMDDEEVKVIAEDFDGFIDYVWNRK